MQQPLDSIPIWGAFLLTIGIVYGAVECGYWLGQYRRRSTETEKEVAVGPVVGATLGLLAFLLAFIFGLAASRFDARRQMVVEEANAIGTTYLRAGTLPEPHRSEVRDLLRKYVDVRLEAAKVGHTQQAIQDSVALHDQLWPHVEALAQADSHSIPWGLFTQALNETIDLHSKRVLIGVHNRIPWAIWLALYLVSALSMAEIGYYSGITGSRRSPAVIVLVVTFSIVILLIMDLDRPSEGMLRVGQHAMLDLQQSLKSATGPTGMQSNSSANP